MTPAGENLADLIQNLCEKSIGINNLFQNYCNFKNKICYITICNIKLSNNLLDMFNINISLVLKNGNELRILPFVKHFTLNEMVKILEDIEIFQYETETFPICEFKSNYNETEAEFANIFAEFK